MRTDSSTGLPFRSGRRRRLLAVAGLFTTTLLATLVASGPALAVVVIDDFEQAAFSYDTLGVPSGLQTGLNPLQCIGGARETSISSTSGIAAATLNIGNPDDEVATVMAPDGRLELTYGPMNVDLTQGGQNERIDALFTVLAADATLRITLDDIAGHQESVVVPIQGPGLHSIFFSDFPTVDLTQVSSIHVLFDAVDEGDYHLADLRARRPAKSMVEFDHLGDETFITRFEGRADLSAGAKAPTALEVLQVELLQASLPSAERAAELWLTGADSGGPAGSFGAVAEAAVGFLITDPGFPASSSLQVALELMPTSESEPRIREGTTPQVLQESDSGFLVVLQADFRDPVGGILLGADDQVVQVGVGQQPITLGNPQAQVDMEGSRLVLTFDVDLMAAKADPDPQQPLLTLAVRGDVDPAVASATIPPPESGVDSFTMWAQPSLMSARAQLRFSRPLESASDVRLYDVAGRLVRSIRAPRGSDYVIWNGRDDSGQEVASGLYVARFVAGGTVIGTKVTKLR